MEEKEKGSLSIVFLIIAIILIVVMGALLYMQKTEADRQIAELENNASKLQETINDLQGKIDTISNTINSNVDIEDVANNSEFVEEETKNTEIPEVESKAKLKFDERGYSYPKFMYSDIEGNEEDVNNWEYASFIFRESGEVEYVDYQAVFKGTYKIVEDKIECDFKEFESESGANEKGKFDKDITLTLISDDKIIGSTLEKRENSGDEVAEFYWGIQKVVYELKK